MVDLVIFIVSDDDDDFIEDVNVDVVIEEDLVSPSKSQNCSTADDLGDSETLYPFDRDVDSVLQLSFISTLFRGEACIPSCWYEDVVLDSSEEECIGSLFKFGVVVSRVVEDKVVVVLIADAVEEDESNDKDVVC